MARRYTLALLVALVAAALIPGAASARPKPRVFVTALGTSYRIDAFTPDAAGRLSTYTSFDAHGFRPWWLAMTSDARNLFVASFTGAKLESFSVKTSDPLTVAHKDAAHGGELATGPSPYGVAVSPDNRNVYVPSYTFAGALWIYDLTSGGGVKPHSPPSEPAGGQPNGVAVNPNGRSVYVGAQDGHIYQFDRASDGSLEPKDPAFVTPKTLGAGGSPTPGFMSLTPNGRHLYAADYNGLSVGIFDVAADGRLTEKASSPVAGPDGAYELAVGPNGRNLYAAGQNDGKVFQWSITPSGGLLPKSPASFTAGQYLDGIWPAPNGRSAYVVDTGTSKVAQYRIDAAGALHALTPATVSTETSPQAAVVTPDLGPIAAFTWPHKRGLKKTFDGSASRDFDGRVARWVWTFGDGTPVLADGPKPAHRYKRAGKYRVTLTVVDDAGCWRPRVYTGQTAYCSGSPGASVTHTVNVKKRRRKCSSYPKHHRPKRCRRRRAH